MLKRTDSSLALTTLLLALLGAPPGPRAAASPAWPPGEAVTRYPEELQVPEEGPRQDDLRRGHAGVRDFLKAHPAWRATVDPWSGGVDRAFGDGIPFDVEVTGSDPEGGFDATTRGFLTGHRALFPPGLLLDRGEGNGSRLVLNEAASRPLADPALRVAQLDLFHDGLPVLGAGLSLGIRNGHVVLVAARALAPVTGPSSPKLDPDEALAAVADWLERSGNPAPPLVSFKEARLAWAPRLSAGQSGPGAAAKHRLVWTLLVGPADAPLWERFVAWVDASDGTVAAFYPEAQSAGTCQPDPDQARAVVTGGVRPNKASDPEVEVPLPYAQVMVNGVRMVADGNGRFPYTGGSTSSTLDGRYFRSVCDNCYNPFQPSATGNGAGDISFDTGGASSFTPTAGNGFSTPADRTAFFHLNQARDLFDKWNGAFFDDIEVAVNIQANCNAFSSSFLVAFFVAGSGCGNTGEIRDVMQHELGHTWDRFDGNDITSSQTSEWKSDMVALAMGGDACIGETFRNAGGPTSACTGVRDIDERAAGRADHPATPAQCPTCATLTRTSNNCGSGPHCWGEIIGQASWHMLRNMQTGVDYITGLPIPAGNPAMSAEQARWIFERLVLGGGPPIVTWNPVSAGLSAYDAFMLMDDEDGNLANGTPNAAYINGAFLHHEVAENPLVADAANCVAPADPAVTSSLESDPATGLATVRLEWTPEPGTVYDVYRNTRDGDGFLPIARDLSGGPVRDIGVQVGATYRYFVAAVRKTGCAAISPGLNIQTVAVNPPTLRVASVTATEVPGASDADGRIEPGERLTLEVTLQEMGGAASATGVTASIRVVSPGSVDTSPGPVVFGAVPAGGSATGATLFEIFAGPAQGCGGRIHVQLAASGAEGCWQDGFDVALSSDAACAATPAAFVVPDPATLAVAAGSGDADGIPDNCEASALSFLIRNVGGLPSGPATATVAAAHPGVGFVPAPLCSVSNLAPGGSALCTFPFTLGGAMPAEGIPLTLTADSAANPAPAMAGATLAAESEPVPLGTVQFGFESPALDGWTGTQFTHSTVRASAGSGSAASGSTTLSNRCGRLTSPPIRLGAGASTLSLDLWAAIEPLTDQWYDRANLHIVDEATGVHTLAVPATGLGYNASGNKQSALCHISSQQGWGGLLGGWYPITFNLSPFAGRVVRIEMNYGTDEGDNREGVYLDRVAVTNAALATPIADVQPDACAVPEVSPAGAPVPLDAERPGPTTTLISFEDLGTGFQYGLYAGSLGSFYSHGTAPVACGLSGSAIACAAGRCEVAVDDAALPAGDLYILVTGTAFGLEGPSGFDSALFEIDPAQSTCSP